MGVRSLFLIFFVVRYSFDLTNTDFKHIKLECAAVVFDIVFVVGCMLTPGLNVFSKVSLWDMLYV